jgi:flagellar hook-associated protein 1 FlgK
MSIPYFSFYSLFCWSIIMAVNLYQTGVSGLLAAQQHLATTGHNISNVNTDGYNVQRAEQNSASGSWQGGNYIGSGVYIENITRVFNNFSYHELLQTQNKASYSDRLGGQLDQLDQTMSTYGTQISESVESFYLALHSIADKPDDISLRKIALTQANTITSNFHDLQDSMTQMTNSTNDELSKIADRISVIAVDISELNSQLLSGGNSLTGQNNDVLDQRDRLVTELNGLVKVSTIEDSSGVMTVLIGEGQTLVAGITPFTMSVKLGDPDRQKSELALGTKNAQISLSGAFLGGQAGALVDFRDNQLKQASAELDLLAAGLSDTLNQAQKSGLDLNGLQGADIFEDLNNSKLQQGRVLAYADNTGNLNAQVTITDVSQLSTDEYDITYDGANYQLTNLTSNVTTSLGPAGAGTYTISAGIQFEETGGAPNANDKFLIRPLQNSTGGFKVTLSDPQAIAASSPVKVTANENNVSPGEVIIRSVTDPVAARANVSVTNPSVTVDVYESAPGVFDYRVFDSSNPPPAPAIASGSYFSGGSAVIDLPPLPSAPAYQIEIKGDLSGLGPDAREQFVLDDAFGAGNGNNILEMADTQNQNILKDNKQTFAQVLSSNVSTVGSEAASIESQKLTAFAMAEQATNRHQSLSGVNLDEEAANMLRFQKAYQASAKIISVANTIFDTILAAVG